ncbi:MAG: hypothetical protein RL722_1020 [Pseudomonadota bacterium]|jgi:hypothetical protein
MVKPSATALCTHPPGPDQAPSRIDAGRRRQLGQLLALGGLGSLGLAGTSLLSGCSSVPQISADVASFGRWPEGRAAGSYAFERLPSQERGGEARQRLEADAAAALAQAGFRAATPGESADVMVQVGSRAGRVLEVSPWFEFGFSAGWWGGRVPPHYPGRWAPYPRRRFVGVGAGFGPFWGPFPPDAPRDFREIALLLVDRASRLALLEVHVRQEAAYVSEDSVGAMFQAALQGFPDLPEGERTVVVPFSRKG